MAVPLVPGSMDRAQEPAGYDSPCFRSHGCALSHKPDYIPALDTLRGLAVLAVLLGHADYFFFGEGFDWFVGGFIGVDLFFVLSGFLITRNLIAEASDTGTLALGRFWARRALRLLPALAVLLLVLIPVLVVTDQTTEHFLVGVLALVFYVFNWFILLTLENIPGTGHLWSLSVEEQFYLLWPLALALGLPISLRSRHHWLLACLASAAAVGVLRARGWWDNESWMLLYLRTDLRADALLLGASLAFVGVAPGRGRPPRVIALGLVGGFAAGVLVLDAEAGYMYLGGFSALALLCTGLVAAAVAGGLGGGQRTFNTLGRMSYGIYLYHMPIVMALASETAARWLGPELLRLGLALGLSVVAAGVSYHYVESPLLRLKQRTF